MTILLLTLNGSLTIYVANYTKKQFCLSLFVLLLTQVWGNQIKGVLSRTCRNSGALRSGLPECRPENISNVKISTLVAIWKSSVASFRKRNSIRFVGAKILFSYYLYMQRLSSYFSRLAILAM